MTSELQGNVVDLCPVGALTAKPYAFVARPWELGKTESFDVQDAVGSAIRVDTRGREVMRILPRVNDEVNEEWISDKTRHVVDGLRVQRLDQPYVRLNGRLEPASWSEAFRAIAAKVKATRPAAIGAIAGDLCGVEEMFALKELIGKLGSTNLDCRQDGTVLDPKWGRASYLFNATIAGIDEADGVMIIGSNPRKEAPVLNARIRKRWRALEPQDRGHRRARRSHLRLRLSRRRHRDARRRSSTTSPPSLKRQIWLVGQGALARPDGAAVLSAVAKAAVATGALVDGWNGFSVLHTAAARVGGLDIGFVPGEGGLDRRGDGAGRRRRPVPARRRRDRGRARRLRRLYRHPWRPRRPSRRRHPAGRRLHREVRAPTSTPRAACSWPAAPRSRPAMRARTGRSCARSPTCSASGCLTIRLPQLRAALFRAHPHLAQPRRRSRPAAPTTCARSPKLGGSFDKAPFRSPIEDFYLTNPIARASAVMAECSALAETAAPQAAE